MSSRQARQRWLTERTTPRFLTTTTTTTTTTARKASASDEETAEAASESKPAVPEDLDYYDGLLGQQPGADNAVMDGNAEQAPTSDYPIPLPSYLLLALATVLSIAFTGSIFEVTGGHPELGYTATYIIGTLSLPGFIFLFYAAIKKGKAEVEEDDAKFGKGRW